MENWEFNKEDINSYIENGKKLLNTNIPNTKKQTILREIDILQGFLKGNYDYKEEYYRQNLSFKQQKNLFLNNMKKVYTQLGPKIIKWLISLNEELIFQDIFKSKEINLEIEEQKEWTLKNYEKHSKILLTNAKQIFSSKPTNQIQICEDIEWSSYSKYFYLANLPLIVVDPTISPAILNHEVEHAIESTICFPTHAYYDELGAIFFETLLNELIYEEKGILPTERLEDISDDLDILSDYFKLILEFAKYDFKIEDNDFKEICIKTIDVITDEFEEYLSEEIEYDYEKSITYIFSHLKAIELFQQRKQKIEMLDLVEPYIVVPRFRFEASKEKFKIYEKYTEEVRQKTLKR